MDLFSISKEKRSDFENIEIPNSTLTFDASFNNFCDFTGLKLPENIESVIFDNNPLVSLRNFPIITEYHNLKFFSAKNTPLSELPLFN